MEARAIEHPGSTRSPTRHHRDWRGIPRRRYRLLSLRRRVHTVVVSRGFSRPRLLHHSVDRRGDAPGFFLGAGARHGNSSLHRQALLRHLPVALADIHGDAPRYRRGVERARHLRRAHRSHARHRRTQLPPGGDAHPAGRARAGFVGRAVGRRARCASHRHTDCYRHRHRRRRGRRHRTDHEPRRWP